MRDMKELFADRANGNVRRHRQQDLVREKRRDEAVKIEENRVRHKIKLALDKASDEIMKKRHELKLREVDRQTQLTTIVENSKDLQNQRLAQRLKSELALKTAKREEELKASGNNIKVIESNIIENGKVVGTRQEILRERYARTDAETQKLLVQSGGNDLQQLTLPSASYKGNSRSNASAANKV
ncbi:hypothetical protein HDU81_000802 [Chytriomyces hyalinus]|nr:hypothetical protein HDU81_000802 [Chytriomyces hyalinus]